MIERITAAGPLNAIANDPDILPWVIGANKPPLDLAPAIADPQNIALTGEHGAMLFARLQPGIFDAHTMVKKSGRGRWALGFVHECLKYMFCRTDALEILTKCPLANLPAKALARAIGGTHEWTSAEGWFRDGKPIPADIYALTVQRWMATAPGLTERGHWFHERLEQEFARLGRTEPNHADDATHDRYVGAACEMFLGGQPHKGVVLYNRWAKMSGYAPIDIVALSPLTIDIKSALIIMRKDDFWVPAVRTLN
jgi:hypothetical protein